MAHRRLRSKRQRALLLSAFGCRCALCGTPLSPEGMHADHVEPFARSGRTNLHELQPLCAACNLRKADGFMDLTKARPGQTEAFNVILDRLVAGETQTAVVLPCGYGKTDVERMVAFEAWNTGYAPCTLVLSPNEYLRDQLVSDAKFSEFVSRYRPSAARGRKVRYGPITSPGVNYAANGEFLLSATIQLVENNVENFVAWIESVRAATGKRPILFVDETHTNSEGNRWGDAVRALRDAGAYLVVLTATALREDGEPLIGFPTRAVSHEPITLVKTRPGATPETVIVEIWKGTQTHHELLPHFQVTFKQAWNDGFLCHVNHHRFDVNLSVLTANGSDTRLLSDLNESDTRKLLGRLVRHPEVIRSGVRRLCRWLTKVRSAAGPAYLDCAGIVFCANDTKDDAGINEHAERIRQAILAEDPSLKVLIATSANEVKARGPSGKHTLERFVFEGRGDVIIVKQMAGLGLDAPRLKVVLDLSPVRTAVSFIQRINRGTRPHKGIMVAHYISPADILSHACFTKFIESEGGATTKEIELQESYPQDKKESEKAVFGLLDVAEANLRDTLDKTASCDLVRRVVDIVEAFPVLLTSYTIPQISERLALFGALAPPSEEEPSDFRNSGDRNSALRTAAVDAAKNVTKIRMARQGRRYSKAREDQEYYRDTIRSAWSDAYRLASLPEAFDYQATTDTALLERVLSAMEAILQEELRQ